MSLLVAAKAIPSTLRILTASHKVRVGTIASFIPSLHCAVKQTSCIILIPTSGKRLRTFMGHGRGWTAQFGCSTPCPAADIPRPGARSGSALEGCMSWVWGLAFQNPPSFYQGQPRVVPTLHTWWSHSARPIRFPIQPTPPAPALVPSTRVPPSVGKLLLRPIPIGLATRYPSTTS